MEGKKNLCAMIPAELHARIMAEKEEMKLGTLAEYVERIFAEHFEGGNDMELKHHPEEWFFLHNFDIDKVFSTIQRADYLILYYIKMQAEQHPDSKVYLADLAAVMGLKVTELSKAVEKLQDKGFVAWKTDREAGRTYVELSSKAVELMAEERAFMQRCYARLRAELGDEELHRAVSTMQSVTTILKDEREHSGV